jgi:WD repeat-containing protein 59
LFSVLKILPIQELITWSRDHTLRIWRVDEDEQKMCRDPVELDEDGPFLDDLPLQKSSSASKFASFDKTVLPACSLQHEFSLLNTNIPHIDVELLDSNKRQAMVKITANGHIIMLKVSLFKFLWAKIVW